MCTLGRAAIHSPLAVSGSRQRDRLRHHRDRCVRLWRRASWLGGESERGRCANCGCIRPAAALQLTVDAHGADQSWRHKSSPAACDKHLSFDMQSDYGTFYPPPFACASICGDWSLDVQGLCQAGAAAPWDPPVHEPAVRDHTTDDGARHAATTPYTNHPLVMSAPRSFDPQLPASLAALELLPEPKAVFKHLMMWYDMRAWHQCTTGATCK